MSYDEENDLMVNDDLESEEELLDLPEEPLDIENEEDDPDNRYH